MADSRRCPPLTARATSQYPAAAVQPGLMPTAGGYIESSVLIDCSEKAGCPAFAASVVARVATMSSKIGKARTTAAPMAARSYAELYWSASCRPTGVVKWESCRPRAATCAFIAATNRSAPTVPVSYTHLRAHETRHDLVCR